MTTEHPWLALDPDEKIVWSGSPRILVIAPIVLISLAGPAILLAIWPTWLSALAGATGWTAIVAVSVGHVYNVEFVVSTKYLYSKRGVFSRAVTQIGLQNVQDASLQQGILGTQFGHGTIIFSTAGGDGDELIWNSIEQPTEVKARVDELIASARSTDGRQSSRTDRTDAEAAPIDGAGLDELLAEARSMRAAAERVDAAFGRDRTGDAGDARPDGGSVREHRTAAPFDRGDRR